MKTQVAIIGAGPSGLMLSHLLHLAGVESVVLERGNREHVGTRMRAGGLEYGTVDLMKRVGLGSRLADIGMVVRCTDFRFDNAGHRLDFEAATGRTFTIYPQYEIVADLLNARSAAHGQIHFDSPVTRIEGLEGSRPKVYYESGGESRTLECDFVAGCDGYHGVARSAIPPNVLRQYEEVYPFAWLGILAEVGAVLPEVAYSCHERGFAMNSFRTPEVSRMYLQCEIGESADDWSDDRIWQELHTRLDVPERAQVLEGRITQKGVTAMRSFVAEPMRYGRLFLAGDAAHIVPPTGAKGLNSAMADIALLGSAFESHYRRNSSEALDTYSQTCLKRVWQVQRFAAELCRALHRFPGASSFAHRMQRSFLESITGTSTGRLWYAENFVGLPFDA